MIRQALNSREVRPTVSHLINESIDNNDMSKDSKEFRSPEKMFEGHELVSPTTLYGFSLDKTKTNISSVSKRLNNDFSGLIDTSMHLKVTNIIGSHEITSSSSAENDLNLRSIREIGQGVTESDL